MSKKKQIGGIVILVILLISAYFVWRGLANNQLATSYTLAKVTRGSLIKTVSGSGQVSASNKVDLSSEVSSEVLKLAVVTGQEVKSGDIIAQLSASDIYKSLRDAEVNLASAKLALQKIQKPTEALTLMQAENALTAAQESRVQAEEDLKKAYDDGFNNVANAFLVLPEIISGLDDVLHKNEITINQDNIDWYTDNTKYYDSAVELYSSDAAESYKRARALYDENFLAYKTASRFSDQESIELLILQTYDTTKNIAEAIKDANNLIQFYQDKANVRNMTINAMSYTHLATLEAYTGTSNSHLLSLLNISNNIKSAKDNIVTAERNIVEKKETLTQLESGADELDIKSQELSIQQKQNILNDIYEQLADYTIRVPFDGVIAAVNVKKGDNVSNGSTLATVITKQSIVELALNEVDAAQVKIGQKSTLTFDAVEDLSVSGVVGEMDTLGTVSQGVVTYTAKIALDIQDDRIKPGMTASASIVTDFRSDVLLVNNSAIKSLDSSYYIEIPNEDIADEVINTGTAVTLKNPIRQQTVVVGLSDDSMTEVSSGLAEGDVVIIKSVTTNTGDGTSASGKSILQSSGAGSNRQMGGSFMPR